MNEAVNRDRIYEADEMNLEDDTYLSQRSVTFNEQMVGG